MSIETTTARYAPPPAPGSPVRALEALAREAGAGAIAREADTLAERVWDGRFYVAVVGQFKRGKSTLINALVGDAVLPAGVVPVTSVVTVVRHGPTRAARVRGVDGEWQEIDAGDLTGYVSEDANPENAKGVAGVEVFVRSPLLASGMCLVDTPGLGSVFRGGTEATRAFAPHIDAALVVVGADPPISEDELALVEDVAQHAAELIVVLNKADRVPAHELREAKRFTERILASRLERSPGPILEVSATEALAGDTGGREWNALRETLVELARGSGSDLIEAAERRGLSLLAERLRREIDEQREALQRPIAESESRIEHLRGCVEDAERALQDLSYLLDAEQSRLRRQFDDRTSGYLKRSLPRARAELAERIERIDERGPSLRHAAIPVAQEVSRSWLDRWRAEEEPVAEALYAEAAQRFVLLANRFLERLSSSGDTAFADLPTSIGPEVGFRVKSRLYYKPLWSYVSGSPFGWIADLFRSRRSILDRKVTTYFERLLETNATRIENDFNDRVLESRRLLESEIRARLKDVYASAERALERARVTRAAGEQVVRGEIERLDTLRRRVLALATAEGEGEEPS